MKKILVICAAIMMVGILPLFAGGKQEAADEGITLKWLMVGYSYEGLDEVLEAFNEKLQEKMPGVKLDVDVIDEDAYDDKSNLIVSSGERFDIMWASSWLGGWKEKAMGGAFLPLNDLLENEANGLYKALPEFTWSSGTNAGNIYAIPVYQQFYTMRDFVARKAIVDAAGVDLNAIEKMATTPGADIFEVLTALEPLIAKAKEMRPDLSPTRMMTGELIKELKYEQLDWDTEIVISRLGETPVKVYNYYETEDFKKALSFFREWFLKGYLPADAATTENWDAPYYATFWDWYGAPGKMRSVFEANYAEPSEAGEEVVAFNVVTPYVSASEGQGSMNFISANSKHPVEALKLLEIINTDEEMYNLLSLGVEGEHYNKVDGGVEYLKAKADGDPLYSLENWVIGNVLLSYSMDPAEKEYGIKAGNDAAAVSPVRGFSFDGTNVASESSQIGVVIEEFRDALLFGTVADYESVYEEFITKMKTAGIDTVIVEAQSQVDAFMAAR